MQYSKIKFSELERSSRLDAEYYSPLYLQVLSVLKNVKTRPIINLCDVSDGNHMSVASHFQENSGVPYFRGQDINTNYFLENANPVFIPEEVFNRKYMKRSYFKPGDVLVSIVGTVGGISLVTESIQKATGSCKIAILRPRKINSEYLSIFLMCKYGNLQIKRNIRGAVQTGLLLEDMDQINICVPTNKFQSIISELVRQAIEQNRNSKSLYRQAENLLLSELKLANWKPKHQLAFIKTFSDTQRASRIDAEYFQPKYDEVIEAVKHYNNGFGKLGNLTILKKSVEPGSNAYRDAGIPFIRVSNLSKYEIFYNNLQYISDELYLEYADHQPQKGEILLSKDATPGIAYYLRETPDKMITSGGILRVKILTKEILPEYLTLVLNSIIVQTQIEKAAGGTIINHWRPDQVNDTVVPILDIAKQDEISRLIAQSFKARADSKKLLETAKRGVEIAIEQNEDIAKTWIEQEVNNL